MDIATLFGTYAVPVVFGICLCTGYILKNLVPNDSVNRYIPLIMGVEGILLNFWFQGGAMTPDILLGGLFSGLASTGFYEALKNLINNGGKKLEA